MKRTVQFAYTYFIYISNSLLELFDPSFVSSDRALPAVVAAGCLEDTFLQWRV